MQSPDNPNFCDALLQMTKRIDHEVISSGKILAPRRLQIVALAALLPLLAACGSTGTAGIGGSDVSIAGDEKGGKIVGGVREGGTQSAMAAVTAHCAQYKRKAFITQMEAPAQGGLLAFVCLESDGRASPKPR